MEISVFLAKAWGIALILIPLTLWFDRSNVQKAVAMMKRNEYIFASGIFCLFLGSVMVAGHNIWVADWRTILTLFGWLSLAKGSFLLSAPELSIKLISIMTGKDFLVKGYLVTSFLLGLYLARVGFFF